MLFIRSLAALALVAFVVSVPYMAVGYPQGAPAGFAGDISDPFSGVQTCAVSGCHSSYGLNSGTGGVSITAPQTAVPGETIPITVTVDNQTPPAPGSVVRQGFQATVRNATGTADYAGTLVIQDAVNTRNPFGSTSYVTHTATGTSQTSWTFGWTVPAADTPTQVIVFAAGNAANGGDLPGNPGDASAGDYIYSTTAAIVIMPSSSETRPSSEGLTLGLPSPNPASSAGRVVIGLGEPSSVELRIVDGLGRTVRSIAKREFPAGQTEVFYSVIGLRSATYFLVAESAEGRRTQPILVAR